MRKIILFVAFLFSTSMANYDLTDIVQKRAKNQISYSMNHSSKAALRMLKVIDQPATKETITLRAINEIKNDLSTIKNKLNTQQQSHGLLDFNLQLPNLGLNYSYAILATLVILILASAFGTLVPFRKKQAPKKKTNYDLEDNEYDFIDSVEGLPSKLDLARAFIQMNEIEDAKKTLKGIIKAKDPQYSPVAKNLLSGLK